MKFSTREDIEAPAEVVYAAMTDFAGFERVAMRHRATVVRADGDGPVGVGSMWKIRFRWRSKDRNAEVAVRAMQPARQLDLAAVSPGFTLDAAASLVPLSRHSTRMVLDLEIRPKTLGARLTLQSLKLARGSLRRRLEARLMDFARSVEREHRKAET